jgi:hypothetical protein
MDDKKIDDAAYRFATSQQHGELLALIDGYKEGYKDAINEFIKDLWHPANEVPEMGRVIIMENYYPDGRIMFISRMRKSTFHNPIDIGSTKKWFYIEDLFSKEVSNE